jgi:hypothetical protein
MSTDQILTIDELPDPPAVARNLVLVVLYSLRYQAWQPAAQVNLSRLGGGPAGHQGWSISMRGVVRVRASGEPVVRLGK